jgi:CCR4-NOT transcription complex subunit 7/8
MKNENKISKKEIHTKIIEVFIDNFEFEIKRMSSFLDKYNIISLDTEFPGIVYKANGSLHEIYYKTIKLNVDNLKLIQVGITLNDENGNHPPDVSAWQFNLKFDWKNEKYSNESIALLSESGIDFNILESKGIPYDIFAEYFMISGFVLNENIKWISFHGSYDFAYLLRLLTNHPLPEDESKFLEEVSIYFHNFYDIRYLIREKDKLKGSLNKISKEMEIIRNGAQHQAGSDSIVTAHVFFKLLQTQQIVESQLFSDRNILYGLGNHLDEIVSYFQIPNNKYYQMQNGVFDVNQMFYINSNVSLTNSYINNINNNNQIKNNPKMYTSNQQFLNNNGNNNFNNEINFVNNGRLTKSKKIYSKNMLEAYSN